MLDGVNDSDIQAKELVRLLKNIKCKVNLIPFNPFPESGLKRSPAQHVNAFASILLDAGMVATVRKTRGDVVDRTRVRERAVHDAEIIQTQEQPIEWLKKLDS